MGDDAVLASWICWISHWLPGPPIGVVMHRVSEWWSGNVSTS